MENNTEFCLKYIEFIKNIALLQFFFNYKINVVFLFLIVTFSDLLIANNACTNAQTIYDITFYKTYFLSFLTWNINF